MEALRQAEWIEVPFERLTNRTVACPRCGNCELEYTPPVVGDVSFAQDVLHFRLRCLNTNAVFFVRGVK